MSSENPTNPSSPTDSATRTDSANSRCGSAEGGRCARRGRGGGLRRLFKGAALLALVAIPISWAWAGPMGHGGGHCGRKGGWGGEVNAASIEAHMGRGAEHLFGRVDATAAQMAEVDTLIGEVAPKLAALHGQKADIHEDALDALSADTVDPAALEGVRQRGLALAGEGSQVVVDTLVGLSRILTVEQRRELINDWSDRDE